MSGILDEMEMALGRFERLGDDHERAANPAILADDIKIATLVKSHPLVLREHVKLNQNTMDTWTDVARLVRNYMKIKQTRIPLDVRSDADGNEPTPMQIGAIHDKKPQGKKQTQGH